MSNRALAYTAAGLAAAGLACGGVGLADVLRAPDSITVTVQPGTPFGVTQDEVNRLLAQSPVKVSRPLNVVVGPGPLTSRERSGTIIQGADLVIRLTEFTAELDDDGNRLDPTTPVGVGLRSDSTKRDPHEADTEYHVGAAIGDALDLGQRSQAIATGIRAAAATLAPPGAGAGGWFAAGIPLFLTGLGVAGLVVTGRAASGRAGAVRTLAQRPRVLAALRQLDAALAPPAWLPEATAEFLLADARRLGRASLEAPRSSRVPAVATSAQLGDEFLRRYGVLESLGLIDSRRAATADVRPSASARPVFDVDGTQSTSLLERTLSDALEILTRRLEAAPRGLLPEATVARLLAASGARESALPNHKLRTVRTRQTTLTDLKEIRARLLRLRRDAAGGADPAGTGVDPAVLPDGSDSPNDANPPVPVGDEASSAAGVLALCALTDALARDVLGLPDDPNAVGGAPDPFAVYEARVLAERKGPAPARRAPFPAARTPRLSGARITAAVVVMGLGAGIGAATAAIIADPTDPPKPPGRVLGVAPLEGTSLPDAQPSVERRQALIDDLKHTPLPADARVVVVTVPLSERGERWLTLSAALPEKEGLAGRHAFVPIDDALAPLERARAVRPDLFTPAGDPRQDAVVLGLLEAKDGSYGFVSLASGFNVTSSRVGTFPGPSDDVEFVSPERTGSIYRDLEWKLEDLEDTAVEPGYAVRDEAHPWRGAFIGASVGAVVIGWWPRKRRR